jgi:hypothetical protein
MTSKEDTIYSKTQRENGFMERNIHLFDNGIKVYDD